MILVILGERGVIKGAGVVMMIEFGSVLMRELTVCGSGHVIRIDPDATRARNRV